MRLRSVAGLVVLLWGLALTEAQAQSFPLAPLLPTNANLGRLKLTRMWWGSATMNASRDKLVHLTLDENLLFAHASSGILSCFDAETGRKLWATHLGGVDDPAFAPASNDRLVMVPSGSRLFALNKMTGDIIWEFPLPRSPSTAPIMDETQVYLGTSDGSVMAFDLTELSRFYDRRLSSNSNSLAVRWKYSFTGHISRQPISSGDLISFTSDSRTVYTVSRMRDLKYTFDAPTRISAGLTSNKGILYICSEDARIFGIDVLTGAMRWHTVVGAPITQTPRVIEDDLFVAPEGFGMFRLRAKDGIEQWAQPARGVDSFVGASPEAIYGSDQSLNLVRLNRATGAILGRLPLDRFRLRVSNDLTDRIYMATDTGMIIALREKDREMPLYFKFPERLPLMPEFAPETVPEEGTEEGTTDAPMTDGATDAATE